MQLRLVQEQQEKKNKQEPRLGLHAVVKLEGSGAGRLVARVGPCVPVGLPCPKFHLSASFSHSFPLPASLRFALLRLHRFGESAAQPNTGFLLGQWASSLSWSAGAPDPPLMSAPSYSSCRQSGDAHVYSTPSGLLQGCRIPQRGRRQSLVELTPQWSISLLAGHHWTALSRTSQQFLSEKSRMVGDETGR